jgi:YfiH family protein
VFYRDSRQIHRSTEFDALPWLIHGFGTRHVDIPSLFENLALVKQIHSAACIAACGRAGVQGEADALIENTPGAVVAVKTADCIPVLLVDERHRAVAAVHAGWRGTVAGVVDRAIEAMGREFGTEPSDLLAAIGPGIGKCCYEVGPEVAAQFGESGRTRIDLAEANRKKLAELGVARVDVAGLCTQCGVDEFHSWRRDKERAGRLYSFIGIASAISA